MIVDRLKEFKLQTDRTRYQDRSMETSREEIYEHLARVYLGKKQTVQPPEPKRFSAWMAINIALVLLLIASVTYGLTAFFTQKRQIWSQKVVLSLSNDPIHITYDVTPPRPSVHAFHVNVQPLDASAYKALSFRVKGDEFGAPGRMRVELANHRREKAFTFVENIGEDWQRVVIPLDQFKELTDRSNLKDISFVFESWNVKRPKGGVLIDDVAFVKDFNESARSH